MNILCVLIPHFALQCEIQKSPSLENCPAIVTCSAGSQRLVMDWSPDIKDVQSGMPLQQALSLHGEARLIAADVTYYARIFEGLLDCLEKISPLVEGTEPGCIYLGLKGMKSLYKDENAIIRAAKKVIPQEFDSRLGIAEGKFTAYLAALFSSPHGFMVRDGDITSFLNDLPCDILPVSLKCKQKLHSFGIETLGQISSLAVGPLQSQFGIEGKKIWELSRGCDTSPLYPRNVKELIEKSNVLPSAAVSMEAILVSVESLLSAIFRHDIKGKGICALLLWANIWGAGYWEQSIKYKTPSISIKTTMSRIKQMLEIHPPPGPVEELGVRITALGNYAGHQKAIFSELRAKDSLLNDIKQMETRLGGPQIFRVKEIEPWSRIPERRQALVPISQ
jgi:DNA polymerase IV